MDVSVSLKFLMALHTLIFLMALHTLLFSRNDTVEWPFEKNWNWRKEQYGIMQFYLSSGQVQNMRSVFYRFPTNTVGRFRYMITNCYLLTLLLIFIISMILCLVLGNMRQVRHSIVNTAYFLHKGVQHFVIWHFLASQTSRKQCFILVLKDQKFTSLMTRTV